MNRAGGRFRHAGPPDHPRLFVAVPLPGEALAAVIEAVDVVRSQPLPEGMRDVRWVRMEGLHLTLGFIGPVAPGRVEAVVQAFLEAASAGQGGSGILAGTGTFPPQGRPRTIWIGVPGGQDTLAALAGLLGPVFEAGDKRPDDRPFRAHLTVARCDGLVAGPLVAGRLAEALADRRIPFAIDRLVLFESITGGGPAHYRPVAEAPLAVPSGTSAVYHRPGSTTPPDHIPGGPGSS